MRQRKIKIQISRERSDYEILIGGDLAEAGGWARKCLGNEGRKIIVVSNTTVFALYGKPIEKSLRSAGFTVSHFLMKDGERYKDLRTTEAVLKFLTEAQLSRADAVIALGGGVVGDLAGFAAAIYLRGIPFLQVPTTLLAMIDSSVGGKTGVNTSFGKNLVGSFHQPRGVFVDTDVLRTLPAGEFTAGFCEAIKQGAVSGRSLLSQTNDFLTGFQMAGLADPNFKSEISNLISSHIQFKAAIVEADERESARNNAPKSRKVLNFGHTLAHAIEKVTKYRYFRHGEAVGHGILFAAELSKSLALCGENDVRLLNDVVHRAGLLPSLANIDLDEVIEAFAADKKNLSGSLQMVLLKGIGKPVIVSEKDIPRTTFRKCLRTFLKERA